MDSPEWYSKEISNNIPLPHEKDITKKLNGFTCKYEFYKFIIQLKIILNLLKLKRKQKRTKKIK